MNTMLVLEIGNPWLKLAVFRSAFGAFYLKGAATIDIVNASEDAIAQSVAEFLKDLKVRKPQAIIVSFSRNAVTLRNLRIPSASPAEIDDMIKLHVGRQVPYAKEEIVNGYRVIGKDTMGYSKVMLAIVHRESIRKIFRILEKANLYTERIELSSDGVLSWLAKAGKSQELKGQEAFIILDVDSAFTDFVVSTFENILFSRVIASGSDQLADEAKWPKFLGEMKQTLVISQGEEILQKPSKVYLGGAVGKLKGLAQKIEIEFNLPVEVVEPLAGMPAAKEMLRRPVDLLEHVSFSPLLGLGLDAGKKKINFVLPEAQIRRQLKERSRDMILFASLLMYLLLIICGLFLEKMRNKQAYLDLLKASYGETEAQSEELHQKVERVKRIKAKLDTKASAINHLYEVAKLLPSEIVIININFAKDEKLTIKGRAQEMSDVFKFITTLESSLFFKDVQTRYTTRKKISGRDINEFELVCLLEQAPVKKKGKKPVKNEDQEA